MKNRACSLEIRHQFGKSLRLWGGVDKRVLAYGPRQIRVHFWEHIPLIEEGGFILCVDHLLPPDVSWYSFWYPPKRGRNRKNIV